MCQYQIQYINLDGRAPFADWLKSLDGTTRKRIKQRILRLEDGNFGDNKRLSDDIYELRFTFGKGYRIYYTVFDNIVILLINGGDKSTQSKDIKLAQKILDKWRLTQ